MDNFEKKNTEEYFDIKYKRDITLEQQQAYMKWFENMTAKENHTEEKFDEIDISAEHLENAFTNRKYYLAMKLLPLQEKQVLYYSVVEFRPLNWISKKLNLSKSEVTKLLEKAKRDFKANLTSKGDN